MSKLAYVGLALLFMFSAGCSTADDPDVRTADWEDNWHRSTQASASGDHQQAISVAEAFLKKHPDNVDGHLMVADALAESARAASDSRRPEQFKEAVTHYTRALELTRNPNWRFGATMALLRINGPGELNDPAQAASYARTLIDADPGNIESYRALLEVLKSGKKYDEAMALMKDARARVEASADAYATYGAMVHDLVTFSPEFPPDMGRALLADTATLLDDSLGKYGRTEKLLLSKGMVLRAQAEIEPAGPSQRAFSEESKRTFDEMDRLAATPPTR